ncbi:hypothetical protein LCGC14_2902010, partial [marine sediment metagenome]
LGLKDAQALRKVTPLARRLMAEEAGAARLGGEAAREARIQQSSQQFVRDLMKAANKLGIPLEESAGMPTSKLLTRVRLAAREQGVDLKSILPGAEEAGGRAPGAAPAAAKENLGKAGRRLGQIDDAVEENGRLMQAIEDRRVALRPAEGPTAMEAYQKYAKLDDQLEVQYKAIEAQQFKLFEEYDSLKAIVDRATGKTASKLTKSVPVHESQEIKDFRIKLSGNGRKPPPPPPPRLPGEPGGLLPGDQAPSMSLWRTIESGLFLSPRSNDLMRRTAEMVGDAPGIKLFMKAITGPAALARVLPEIRAGVVYRRVQGVMEAQLGQRLVGQEEAFHRAFTLGRDTSKVVWQGKEVAFGDVATNILKGPRIGAKHGKFAATPAQREWVL